mmetsp:Transcript_20946/g.34544  ORF Transcript_20946/g.34544 Transcript_20946/m.34544 type:complete len:218 (-) Transcript_20946:294-947(-)
MPTYAASMKSLMDRDPSSTVYPAFRTEPFKSFSCLYAARSPCAEGSTSNPSSFCRFRDVAASRKKKRGPSDEVHPPLFKVVARTSISIELMPDSLSTQGKSCFATAISFSTRLASMPLVLALHAPYRSPSIHRKKGRHRRASRTHDTRSFPLSASSFVIRHLISTGRKENPLSAQNLRKRGNRVRSISLRSSAKSENDPEMYSRIARLATHSCMHWS